MNKNLKAPSKKLVKPIRYGLIIFLVCLFFNKGFSQNNSLVNGSMTQEFYAMHQKPLFWFSSLKNIRKAHEWLKIIEASDALGLQPDKILIHRVQTNLYSPKLIQKEFKIRLDTQITAIVLNFLKTFQEGSIHFDYNILSVNRDSVYVFQLLRVSFSTPVAEIIQKFDCRDHDYLVLKKLLHDSVAYIDNAKYKSILLAMNYQRFISLNQASEYIIVNIAAAEVKYYQNDSMQLKMRAVVGAKNHPTPTIASYITSVVTFPFWNVPHSIAVKEILPKIHQNENYLEENNMEVVDASGIKIDDSDLNWKSYGEQNFPYFFRQATGSENAMGVLKFNLQNPFSIYLHATNWQGVFEKENRFLSHGCIRLENPFALANFLLPGKIDFQKLRSQQENIPSQTLQLNRKIQCYLMYSPAVVLGEKVVFMPDYYKITNP